MTDEQRFVPEEVDDAAIAHALGQDGAAFDEVEFASAVRKALDDYRAVLAQLPLNEVVPPASLEDRVVDAALRLRPASIPALDRARRRRSTARMVTLGAAAVAATGVITLMVVGDTNPPTVHGRVEAVSATVPDAPGTRRAQLEGAGGVAGELALGADGDGLLYEVTLPVTPGNADVFLWLLADGQYWPVGSVPEADRIAFDVFGDIDAVSGVALSLEEAGTSPARPSSELASARFADD